VSGRSSACAVWRLCDACICLLILMARLKSCPSPNPHGRGRLRLRLGQVLGTREVRIAPELVQKRSFAEKLSSPLRSLIPRKLLCAK
jgi:hypothetical protein